MVGVEYGPEENLSREDVSYCKKWNRNGNLRARSIWGSYRYRYEPLNAEHWTLQQWQCKCFWLSLHDVQAISVPTRSSECSKFCGTNEFLWKISRGRKENTSSLWTHWQVSCSSDQSKFHGFLSEAGFNYEGDNCQEWHGERWNNTWTPILNWLKYKLHSLSGTSSHVVRMLFACCACCASRKSVQNKRIVCAEFAHCANKSDLFGAKLSSCKTQKFVRRDLWI